MKSICRLRYIFTLVASAVVVGCAEESLTDIGHYAAPAGEYWLFELESGNRETNLKIDAAGNIVP
jgi:hypothetical protein